jgi:hypothetical protein
MMAHTDDISVDLPCHLCGYDLRAHPQDGKCPECGESVAESSRWAAIPRRPAWRDSDPRWRRRMLAGAWILVFLPLIDALQVSGWAARIPVPEVFDFRGTIRTLDETLLCGYFNVYQPLAFCIGVVLLFSKERGRRSSRLDWTRRWGIFCTYISLLLSAVPVLFIGALVLAGIAALFQAMPLKYQPGVTQSFVKMSTAYLYYGPYPNRISGALLPAFSSIAVLLACIPLFNALRGAGSKRLAKMLLAPLALFSLIHLAQVVRFCLDLPTPTSEDILHYGVYFWPELLLGNNAGLPSRLNLSGSVRLAFFVEAVKWCIIAAIAIWLSIAQVKAWWQRKQDDRTRLEKKQGPNELTFGP